MIDQISHLGAVRLSSRDKEGPGGTRFCSGLAMFPVYRPMCGEILLARR